MQTSRGPVSTLRSGLRQRRALVSLVLLLLLLLLLCACGSQATRRGRRRYPDDEEAYRPSRRRVPVLIDARRLRDAVVERHRRARLRSDEEELRESLCEGREEDPVIFLQLVIARRWHYYWLCSSPRAERAATETGRLALRRWVGRIRQRAVEQAADCRPESETQMFRKSHVSGVRAIAYCGGRIVLRFFDGSRKSLSYGVQRSAGGSNVAGAQCPICRCGPTDGRPTSCPRPKRCPKQVCPTCDCSKKERAAGEQGFWQGVGKACKRICRLTYERCREINPNTALCHQVREYCNQTCAKR